MLKSVFFMLALFATSLASAEVDIIIDDSDGVVSAVALVTGELTSSDPEKFSNLYKEKMKGFDGKEVVNRFAYLNSPGGDAYAAMRLGRMLRERKFDAFVFPESGCYSSCVYLLSAGMNKTTHGKVGIHRPYLTDLPSEFSSVQKAMRETLAKSKEYFVEMNVPEGLAEEMFSTPPHEMKILTKQELRSFRLDQEDMVENEKTSIDVAEQLNVDRRTLLKFYADINSRCESYQLQGDAASMKKCICRVSENYPSSIQESACMGVD